jgi:hypothetical protein
MYRLKKGEFPERLQRIGDLMQRLVAELKRKYEPQAVYQMLERVFGEHYQVEAQRVRALNERDLSCHRLLSPDDADATIRARRGSEYHGYVVNLCETCDPENPFQLITQIQVDSNRVDDPQLLLASLPKLSERMKLDTLYTDGGFGSFEVDQALLEKRIHLIASAIRGRGPNPQKLSLADFTFQMDEASVPVQIGCPQGQSAAVIANQRYMSYSADFLAHACTDCPLVKDNRCRTKLLKRKPFRHLRFRFQDFSSAKRRQQVQTFTKSERNLRAAIEATCRALKCRFPRGKFPVRGKFRISCMLVGSASLNNVRRITRFCPQ